jgi:small subunit ribosomal protein S16
MEVDLSVKIRLRRMGAKRRPSYRFVATDSRMSRDGRFIEILGHYDPIEKPAVVSVKEERVYYWLKQGALPTDTVNSIFKQIGLLKKWEMIKKGEDASQVSLLTQLKERAKKKKKKKGQAKEEAAPPPEEKAPPEKAEAEVPKEEKIEEKQKKEEEKGEGEEKREEKEEKQERKEKKEETKEEKEEDKKVEKEKEKKEEKKGEKKEEK